NDTAISNSTVAIRGHRRAATECRTITVDDSNNYGILVTRYGGGLTAANFYKYNPSSTLYSSLRPGQRVYCTAGDLPDIRPKQKADGSCFLIRSSQVITITRSPQLTA